MTGLATCTLCWLRENEKNPFQYSFYRAAYGMPARTSYEKAVCPPVCLSVKRVDCDKTQESSVQIPYERAQFSEKNDWWGRPLLSEILGHADPVGAKSPIFSRYSLIASQW